MKKLKQTKDNQFVCEECKQIFKLKVGLSKHVNCKHNSKEYYNKWLKDENEEICPICKKENKFNSIIYGYSKTCTSSYCSHQLTAITSNIKWLKEYGKHPKQTEKVKNKCIENNLIKYGVEYTFQREDVKQQIEKTNLINHKGVFSSSTQECINKVKQTKFEKYDDENYVNPEKAKQTKIEKYDDENYNNREKAAKTNIIKYGNISPLHGEEQIKKKKATWIKKYGVENPNQNLEIFNKGLKTRLQIHKYKDTNLTYQGSYELDFLKKYYDLFPDMQNGPSIKYIFNDKNKVYHSDFFIPSKNLVIEIKSWWTLTQDTEIEEKKKATIANGFNYIIILDKDYSQFNKLICQ